VNCQQRCSGRPPKKEERRTKAAPDTPAKGHTKQHSADAPYGARLQGLLFVSRALRLRLAVCLEAVLDAHASFQIVSGDGDSPQNGHFSPQISFWEFLKCCRLAIIGTLFNGRILPALE